MLSPARPQTSVAPKPRLRWLFLGWSSLWLLVVYLGTVLPLDSLAPSVNDRAVAGLLWLAAAAGSFAAVRRLHESGLKSLTLMNVVFLLCFVTLDVAYTVRLNRDPRARQARDLDFAREKDPQSWLQELSPNVYYPTENNFYLYKPYEHKGGYTYGEHYYPALQKHPLIRDSVLQRHHVEFSIDQYGLRNTHPPEEAAIFTLGDSFCYGYDITQASTFQELLGAKLGQPVYNMGLSGTSPFQQLLAVNYLFSKYPQAFHPRRLLWLIFEGNDLEETYSPERNQHALQGTFAGTLLETLDSLPFQVRRESVIRRLSKGELTLVRPAELALQPDHYHLDGEKLNDPIYHSKVFGYRLFRPDYLERGSQPESYVLNHPNLPRLKDTFLKMRELARQRGFDVTVVTVPSASRLYKDAYEDMPPITKEPYFIQTVLRLSQELGFAHVDLNELLAPYAQTELLYNRDDTHWNERGHQIVADLLAQYAVK